MKKLFTIAIFALLFTACSTDSEEITGEQVDFATNQASGAYDESNLGIYKGVFTTLSSSARATVYIKIDGVGEPYVEFNFPDREDKSFKAATVISKNASNSTTNFTSKDFSFDFTVNPDGTEPTITNLTYMGEKGDALIVKETSKNAIETKTGFYTCESGCFGDEDDTVPHPELGAPGARQTFSFVSSEPTNTEGSDVELDVQIVLNRRTYTGNAYQTRCADVAFSNLRRCALVAETNLNGNSGPLRFRSLGDPTVDLAHHTFATESDENCSTYEGNIIYRSTLFGRSVLAFETDDTVGEGGDCLPD